MLCDSECSTASHTATGFSELQSAIRIHGNAVEYIPVALILLLFMEMNGAETRMVHICGLLLIAGRLMHYYGFHHRLFRWRRSGMSATWCSLLLMVLANLWYMPWELVSPSVSAQYATLFFPDFYVMSDRDTLFPRLSPARATGPSMNG